MSSSSSQEFPDSTLKGVDELVSSTQQLILNPSQKRTDYISWHEFFMGTAILAAQRSKDPCTQVGACIVTPENKVVGTGYNGMPINCEDDDFPWGKSSDKLNSKFLYVCHAEMNAVVNSTQNVKGCRIYVCLFPCNECCKIIIQSRINEVIYLSDKNAHKDETKAAKRMFDAAGIKYWQFFSKVKSLTINFEREDDQGPTT